jgi:hypothetical protein
VSTQHARKLSVVNKGGKEGAAEGIRLASIGLEAELGLVVDGRPERPEHVFGTPRAFIRGEPMHRVGTSYHLPTGAAVYFDTGVIEVATPLIEIARGCGARAARSLWESVAFVRSELDAWEAAGARHTRLTGFSAHYNTSFRLPGGRVPQGTVAELALLLAYILPVPVMLLAANRRSTGVGVRPRADRVEVTVDFTPDPALMVATASVVTGIVRAVMGWPSFAITELASAGIPVLAGYVPQRHTSRHGWLARFNSYPRNPFATGVDALAWRTRAGDVVSLRQLGRRITQRFWPAIRAISDPFALRLIAAIMRGRAPSPLELPERPLAYDDVGRLCTWGELYTERALGRSRYERVLRLAISGRPLVLGGEKYLPVGMRGWSQVVFRRERDASRHILSIDFLLQHLRAWSGAGARRARRRKPAPRWRRSASQRRKVP